MTRAQMQVAPERLPFQLDSHERGRTPDELWEEAIADLRSQVAREGAVAMERIAAEYDDYSLYEFLRDKGWSRGAIAAFTVCNFLESDMHNSFVEVLREDLGGAYVDMQEIAGGMDLLPAAVYAELAEEIRFGAEVFAVDQEPSGVTVHFKTESGWFSERADYAILTVPFPVLRTIEILAPFSSGKQRAFQCLVYLHRYNEGTLSRMRTEYVIPLQGKINARIDHLTNDAQQATSISHRKKLEKEQDTLRKQQAELLAFDEKLRHYADMRISLDLDDGSR